MVHGAKRLQRTNSDEAVGTQGRVADRLGTHKVVESETKLVVPMYDGSLAHL